MVMKVTEVGGPQAGRGDETRHIIFTRDTLMRRSRHHAIQAAPPCRLRLILDRPRAGLQVVPSQARPSLFGGD